MFMKGSGERLRNLLDLRRIPRKDFAEAMSISPQQLNNWFGRDVPGAQLLRASDLLGVRPQWLSDGEEPRDQPAVDDHPELIPFSVWDDETPLSDDEVEVPFLREVELAAGSGRTVIQENGSLKLRFGKRSLRNQGVHFQDAVCVTVAGNSMEPVLRGGSTVGVDRGKRDVVDGDLYALSHDGQLRVKQLYRLPGGGLRLRSFNRDEHPDESYTLEQVREQALQVIGRVFWSSQFH